MTRVKGKNIEIISVSLDPRTVQGIDKAVEILEFDNRSTMVEKAIKEFLIREVVRHGKKF